MSIFKKKEKPRSRADPGIYMVRSSDFAEVLSTGYTRLIDNPEVASAINKISELIGSMTIHLMRNGENGDIRVKNELSRKLDIEPNQYMTRASFINWIVKTMLTEGNSVVWPKTRDGYIDELIPVSPSCVSFMQLPTGWGYTINVNGKAHRPSEMLHFAVNPDLSQPWRGTGYRVALKDVVNNLRQAAATEKAFAQSKWMPSLIIKVDSMTEEFSSPSGRKKLLDSYVRSGEVGEPWLIPAEQFQVEQIKPLTLADLALPDFVQLNKKTVAAVIGVPAFVLGVGDFNKDEWNNFITARIMPVAQIIEQELTKKILYSPDLYFKFNSRSLYSYDLSVLADVADNQYVRGIMTGNEVRDWLGLSPLDGLDERVILENYIPADKIGDQSKLK